MDIREVALQAAGESVRRFVRPEDEVLEVYVTPNMATILFRRDTLKHALTVTHLPEGEQYTLRPLSKSVLLMDYPLHQSAA